MDQLRVVNFVILIVHDLCEVREGFFVFIKPTHIDELDFDCFDLHLRWMLILCSLLQLFSCCDQTLRLVGQHVFIIVPKQFG